MTKEKQIIPQKAEELEEAPTNFLYKVIEENNLNEVEAILNSHPEIVNVPDKSKNYALHYAVADGNEKLTKILLKTRGVDINIKNVRNLTALHIAVANAEKENYQKIIELLLREENIDLEARDLYGNTPLHYAAEKGNWELLKKLLENSQKKQESIETSKIENAFGWTLLHSAVSGVFENKNHGCWKVIEELLKDRNFKFNEKQISSTEELLEEDQEKLEKYKKILSKYSNVIEESPEEEKLESEFKILIIPIKKN